MAAVLTADVVHSTLLDRSQEELLTRQLGRLLTPYHHEFYRGDSFQVFMDQSADALQLALLCRTTAIALATEGSELVPDIRISIGLGTVQRPVGKLGTARGEAFLLSGRGLDEIDKTKGRLVISATPLLPAVALSVCGDYMNSLCSNMTPKQAEVIHELLKGETQQQVAEKLGRSKSTISQHVSAGRWDEMEALLKKYKQIVEIASL